MPTEVIMPALGMAQEKGTLVRWLKTEGEPVTRGEPLMEVETDKATVEIEAPASGILSHISAKPGDEVPVGHTIAVIFAAGERAAFQSPHPRPPREGEGRGEGLTAAPRGTLTTAATGRPVREKLLASPAAKRIAREKSLDLRRIAGSGPEGAILAADVLRAAEGQVFGRSEPAAQSSILPLTSMRRIVGERMAKSKQTAPHFYLSTDVDMTAVEKQRAKRKEEGAGPAPSVNDWIVWSCARALREFPLLNSRFTEGGIEIDPQINVGVAVAVDDGLVVPVIRHADTLTIDEIARRSAELVEKARTKKLLPADCEGGTFTVSNLGMFGVDSFTAIINPPQCAILAVGRVAPRVVVHGEGIAVRSLMTITLSADHRIVDGAIAARFLQQLKTLLEKPAE
ncbi:MAG TPA: dihydrolipoamide acetyltransferase family protein [Candidatus Acidoferrales bacterium]|nr:dihydrolipoamide acetyltransferase family protein [Candidatus Acidoferrales bacterium]